MKKTQSVILIIFLFSTCFLQSVFAQDYTQWGLPNGAIKRLGKGDIYGNITFSPDSSLLAVASSIGIWIYDGYTGKELNLLSNNRGYSASVAFSPDGEKLVSCDDTDIHFWDVATGNLIYSIPEGHTRDITCVAFNPNGKTIATSSGWGSGTVKFWDVSTGKLVTTLTAEGIESVNAIAFSPDGTVLASGSEYENDSYIINLWDVATGKLKRNLYGHKNEINNIAFNRDGITLASCSGYWFLGGSSVRLWDIVTGKLKATLREHPKSVNSIAFSPDGNTLASGGRDNLVCLWDAVNGTYKTALLTHRHSVESVAFSPDGRTLASGSADGTVILWDADSLQQRTTIAEHTTWGDGIDFSPDGQQIVTGCSDTTVRLWDTSTGKNTKTLRGHRGMVYSVAFSSDGHTIASSAGWLSGIEWDYPDNTIRLWDANSGTHKATLLGHTHIPYNVTFSPDGRTLASCGDDEKMILWDTVTGNPLWTINADKTNNQSDYITVAFSPDGRMLASRDETEIRLWDIESRQPIATFTIDLYRRYGNLVFSPDGKTLATDGRDNVVLLWDVASGMEKTIHTGHTSQYMKIAFSPDRRSLVTAGLGYGGDGTVRFWEPTHGMLKLILNDIPDSMENFKLSPDEKTLATLSAGGSILLWDYASLIDPPPHEADTNRDGYVNIHDLVVVAANFGKNGPNDADVNGDGVVNIADLIKVAGALDNAAAPSALHLNKKFSPTRADVKRWLTQAQQLNLIDVTSQKGVRFLEQLLSALTPKKTALLPNYPNPFNPETWIPYQLADAADVRIQIYSSDAKLIRTLVLGHQPEGLYQHRSRAAYWDGKNEHGEPVASGVYFYTLTAGKFTATRRMVIRK